MYHDLLLSEGGGIITANSVAPQMGDACLMIGIGGSGVAALRRVKREVHQHLEPDDPAEEIPHYRKIAFLGMDTDTDDLSVQNPDITDLQSEEQFSLELPNLGALLGASETRRDPLLRWMAEDLTMQGTKGAGGVRQVGRFCLFRRAEDIRARLNALVHQVMAAANSNSVEVHVFAGISGGTGSGCFLDVCYILRDILANTESNIYGYFFLPDTQLHRPGIEGDKPKEDYNKRNGYAALRDLDYCMSIPASGDCFEADYALGFHVSSRQAPVDLCHLVSATTADGIVKPDGFNYGLSVVAEYVLSYLTDVNATQGAKAADNTGLTMRGHTINVATALGTIRPRVGAERNYHIVGASTAELPLTHIATYLAACTYGKMMPNLGRHSSKQVCQAFAGEVGITVGNIIGVLSAGINPNIAFNPDMDLPAHLGQEENDWDQLIPDLYQPIENYRVAAVGVMEHNFSAQSRDLESFDAARNGQVEHPTLVLQVFNALIRICKDAEKGPTLAADLLHGDGIHDLRAELDGALEQIVAAQRGFAANVPLRVQDIRNAAKAFNKAVVGKKKKLQDYEQAWIAYKQLDVNLQLCRQAQRLIPALKTILERMYQEYFLPLSKMVEELSATFQVNLDWLNSPQHSVNDSFCWRIFQYDSVKDALDDKVLRGQDLQIEQQNFMDYLIANFQEWTTQRPYRVARCINQYMLQHFNGVLNQTIDGYLMEAFGVTNAGQLPDLIKRQILQEVSTRATPLFWVDQTFQMDSSTTVSNNVMSVPSASAAIATAASQFQANTTNMLVRSVRLGDRITCLRFVSGIPFYAYAGIKALGDVYHASSGVSGMHLHERDENWGTVLPQLVPYSLNKAKNNPDRERAELYDLAQEQRIIAPKSKAFPDKYFVRIINSTEALVQAYQKEQYYFAGALNQGELKRAIAELKAKREGLLPETIEEDMGRPLPNDGFYDPEDIDPEKDYRNRVRRDYFVRFVGLQREARKSLDELRRVDDKIAEMEGWLREEEDQQQQIRRLMQLSMMGYVTQESPVKLRLDFVYRTVPMKVQLCDVDAPYRYAPEYQAYLALDELNPAQREQLYRELDEKYRTPQAQWGAALERLIASAEEDQIQKYYERYLNDGNIEALTAFYRLLRKLAEQEKDILPVGAEPEKTAHAKMEEQAVASVQTITSAGGWRCSCGTDNAEEDLFCGECGMPRPSANREPETWTCRSGHVVPWAKKFCGKCGPAGGKRPWLCVSCGTPNEDEDGFCCECGAART